jgi:hypothetical protein
MGRCWSPSSTHQALRRRAKKVGYWFGMSSPPERKSRPSVSSMTMVEGVVIEDTSAPPPPPSLMAAQGLPRRRSVPSDGGIAFSSDGPGQVYARPTPVLEMHGNVTAAIIAASAFPAPVIAPRAPLQFGSVAAAAANVDKAKQGLQAKKGLFAAIGAATTAFSAAAPAAAPPSVPPSAVRSSPDRIVVKGERFNDDALGVLISGMGSGEGSQRRVRRLTSALRARGFEVCALARDATPEAETDALWRSGCVLLCLTAADLENFDGHHGMSDGAHGNPVGRTYERALRTHMPRRMVPVRLRRRALTLALPLAQP